MSHPVHSYIKRYYYGFRPIPYQIRSPPMSLRRWDLYYDPGKENMTTTIANIIGNITHLSEINFGEINVTELQVNLNSVRKVLLDLIKIRDEIEFVIADKINKDEVDQSFDAEIEMSYENMTGLVSKTRKAFDELGFSTKASLPGLIAAIGGYQTMNTFSVFVCKCAEQNIGTFDKSRLEAVLCILLRAARRGMLVSCNWDGETDMFNTIDDLRRKYKELGIDDTRRELLADLGSLRRLDNTDPDELLGI